MPFCHATSPVPCDRHIRVDHRDDQRDWPSTAAYWHAKCDEDNQKTGGSLRASQVSSRLMASRSMPSCSISSWIERRSDEFVHALEVTAEECADGSVKQQKPDRRRLTVTRRPRPLR